MRNTTKSPSISADILRPAVFAIAPAPSACLCLVRHRARQRITAAAAASGDARTKGASPAGGRVTTPAVRQLLPAQTVARASAVAVLRVPLWEPCGR